MEYKLKPCPFCGKNVAKIATCRELDDCKHFEPCETFEHPYYTVICSAIAGGCGGAGGYSDTEAEAANNRNRRIGEE